MDLHAYNKPSVNIDNKGLGIYRQTSKNAMRADEFREYQLSLYTYSAQITWVDCARQNSHTVEILFQDCRLMNQWQGIIIISRLKLNVIHGTHCCRRCCNSISTAQTTVVETLPPRTESSCSPTADCTLVTDSDIVAAAHAGRSNVTVVVGNNVDLDRYHNNTM